MLDLIAELMNQAAARAVEAGQQAAPEVPAAPKSFPSNCVVHSEIGIGWPVAKMKGQIRSKTPIALRIDRSGLIFRGEHKDQFRLITALDDPESAPSFQLSDCISTDGGESGFVFKID